jgi:hypothetical protein
VADEPDAGAPGETALSGQRTVDGESTDNESTDGDAAGAERSAPAKL